MPAPETSNRYQHAVLWERTGADRYGEPTRGEPVELRVRWVQKRGEVTDAQGNRTPLDAAVVVDRQIPVGSLLWLGTLDSWQGTGSVGADSELHEVVTYSETPDVKGRVALRSVGLKRFRDALPAQG